MLVMVRTAGGRLPVPDAAGREYFMHLKEAKHLLSAQNGMNLYRGCTHGCIYCDSRSECYQMKHDFEDIEVKSNALTLLEQELRRKRRRCMIGTGAMSDPYLHAEIRLQHMRKCLELIDRYGFGVAVQTKSDRILRDLDLYEKIQAKTKAVVQMTLTTWEETLCRILEPHVCTTQRRVEALYIFRDCQIPTVVWLTPILPFINDTEENLREILNACIRAKVKGIVNFGFGVTLRAGDREYFYRKLDEHFPGMKERYIRTFGNAYEVPSPRNARLTEIFREECVRHGILYRPEQIFEYLHTFEDKGCGEQLRFF